MTKNKEQEICKSCGLCCDGTLFANTAIEVGELFPDIVQDHNNKLWLKQPCCYFDQQCTIYDKKRPQDCSNYKCNLLKDFSANQLKLAEASTLIQQIKSQKERLYRLIPNADPNHRLEDNFKQFLKNNKIQLDSKQFKLRHSALLLEWSLYQIRLTKFHKRKK